MVILFLFFSNGEDHVAVYNNNINMETLRNEINKIDEEKDYVYYYPMRETLETQNDIFIPYEIKDSLPEIYVENEIALLDYKGKAELAEKFF